MRAGGPALGAPVLRRKHPATLFAVGTALLLAFHNGTGKGALALWPLFGSVNQLLAGLALLVITIYLAQKRAPIRYTLLPMLFMLSMTSWAITLNLATFWNEGNTLLFAISAVVLALMVWMVAECALVLRRALSRPSRQEPATF